MGSTNGREEKIQAPMLMYLNTTRPPGRPLQRVKILRQGITPAAGPRFFLDTKD